MKISIITVTYNAIESIEQTLLSILGQTYRNIEVIVIDGGSTDGTLKVLEKYRDRLAVLVSEPDKGIYDAMNKGVSKASGAWVNFMNAGDCFCSPQVIENVFADAPSSADVIYGNYRILYPNFAKLKKVPPTLHELYKGMIINHQSLFVRLELAKQHPFDLAYRLAADFKQVFSLYTEGRKFHYVDQLIADFTDGGLSAARKLEYIRQCREVVRQSGWKGNIESHYRKALFKTQVIDRFKSMVPDSVFEVLMKLKYKLGIK